LAEPEGGPGRPRASLGAREHAEREEAGLGGREPKRAPFVALVVGAALAALVLAATGAGAGQVAPAARLSTAGQATSPSSAERVGLSSSWFCAGGTASGAPPAAGELVISNANGSALKGSAEVVSVGGLRHTERVLVPAGSSEVLSEDPLVLPGRRLRGWVGAVVTLYGGMASVSQVVKGRSGTSEQPCASSAARHWYFASGSTLRNAAAYVSLLNPYPEDAVADLSFSTEYGREDPLAFQGLVVPPLGLTVVDLGTHLRRRQEIATTVSVRTGELVAYETEVVAPPPPGAPLLGASGAANPAAPVAGVELTLGATAPATELWWPNGGDGPGLTESYDIYNPGPSEARLTLSLLSGQASSGLATPGLRTARPAGGLSSSSQLVVPAVGWASGTTNGQPWALPASTYAAHLESTNGVPVVAERVVAATAPSATRGLAVLGGQAAVARQWLIGGLWRPVSARLAGLGQAWLGVFNPGPLPSKLVVEDFVGGRVAPVAALGGLRLGPGERAGVRLPLALARGPLALVATKAVAVEQDWYYPAGGPGTDLEPGVPLLPG
jgi:hypothetical protein